MGSRRIIHPSAYDDPQMLEQLQIWGMERTDHSMTDITSVDAKKNYGTHILNVELFVELNEAVAS